MRDLRVRLARLEQESERQRLFDQTEAPVDSFTPSGSLLREALACLIDCGAISVAGKNTAEQTSCLVDVAKAEALSEVGEWSTAMGLVERYL